MNGKEIPGFYWDPDKKKYFRIQANHVAPTGSQYSREAVKKRKIDTEHRKQKAIIGRRVRSERVQTPRCLSSTFTRLNTEVGNRAIPAFVKKSHQGDFYAAQLQRHNICNMDGIVSSGSMADFARHGPSGVLVAGINTGGSCKIVACPPSSRSTERWNYKPVSDSAQLDFHYRLSSISMCESAHFLATMDSGNRGESALGIGFLNEMNALNEEGSWRDRHIPISRIEDSAGLWCSSARPGPENPLFAIGTSDGLYTVAVNPDRLTLTRAHISISQKSSIHGRRSFNSHNNDTKNNNNNNNNKVSTDLLAVEWHSNTVIASGFRNSFLYLSDLRSNGHSKRIKHTNSIEQIKKIDDYRLVVAGYKSLHMYDLRYTQQESSSHSHSSGSGSSKNRRNGMSTNPYLVFDDYTCEIGHRIDTNQELGLLVSVTHDQSIRFYSLANGAVAPSPRSLLQQNKYNDGKAGERGGNICRVIFEEFEYPIQQQQTPRILYAQGSIVKELAW